MMETMGKPDKSLDETVKHICDVVQERIDEAYHKGWEYGKEYGSGEADMREAVSYQKGLDDAWECARELYLNGACKDLFGEYFSTFIKYHTAQEAIEKLKAYEAEQGHSDTIDESYTIGYKQANNNSKSNTECDGCLYDYGIKEHSLCHTCSNAYINHWTAKKQDDNYGTW